MFHSRIVRGVIIQSFDFNLLFVFVSLNLVGLCKYAFPCAIFMIHPSSKHQIICVCNYMHIQIHLHYAMLHLYVSLIGISTSPEKHLDIEDVFINSAPLRLY